MIGDGYIIKIAKHFNVSTDFLLGETDIPDRKNYDIEELGLSAESAKLLYTGKIDSGILNLLLENPKFAHLIRLLALYKDETMLAGIRAANQNYTFLRSRHPEAFSVLMLRRRDLTPKQMSLTQISARTITIKIPNMSLSEKRRLQKSEMPLEKSLIVNEPIFITASVFSIMCFMINVKPLRIFISV